MLKDYDDIKEEIKNLKTYRKVLTSQSKSLSYL